MALELLIAPTLIRLQVPNVLDFEVRCGGVGEEKKIILGRKG